MFDDEKIVDMPYKLISIAHRPGNLHLLVIYN